MKSSVFGILVIASQILLLFEAPLAHALCKSTENIQPTTVKLLDTDGVISAYEDVDNLNLNPYNASSAQHLFSDSGQIRVRFDRLNDHVRLCVPKTLGTVVAGRYMADYDILPASIRPVTDKHGHIFYLDAAATALPDITVMLRVTSGGHLQIARPANATFTAGAGRGFFDGCIQYRVDV
jgi:hypothetical protein